MFNLVKKKLIKDKSNLLSKIDLHSHLIPEIDDGCHTVEESIELIQRMQKLGYKKLIVTPHIMSHRYPNTIKIIKQGLFSLRGMLKVKNIDIEIDAAAEYYVDEPFLKNIPRNQLLYFGNKYVLFECSYTTRPKELEEVILAMLQKDYKPVLAHPERYKFLTEISEYRELKKLGVFFQLNLNSLGGYYGNIAQKKANMLSSKGMVDFIGSDIHNKKHMRHYEEMIYSNYAVTLFRNNKILNDNI